MQVMGPAELRDLARDPQLPFMLVLPDASFVVTTILRHLPGRRLTVGVQDGVRGDGVLKLFFGARYERDWRRAMRGQEAFARAAVATTPVIAQGQLPASEGGLSWMLFPRVVDAVEAGEADAPALAAILGRLHFHGYSHTDLHLGNFLRTPSGELLSIDADAIEARVLSLRSGLRQLAILLAQFEIPTQPDVDACLDAYLAGRRDSRRAGTGSLMRRLLARAVTRRSAHYLLKALRECTNFIVRTEGDRRLYCRREEAGVFDQFASDPERFFADRARILKRGNSATVVGVEIGRRALVAKRYNITGFGHRLRRIFRKRAREAWQAGLRLKFLGIPTAAPLGLIETGPWWWPGPAYVLMEHLAGKDLATLTRSGYIDSFTLGDLVGIVAAMQRAGLTHGDLKSTNFILSRGRLYLIDVDSIRVSGWGRKRDVARLLDNWATDAPARQAVSEAFRAAGLKGA